MSRWLKELRLKKGLSQEKISQIVEISQNYYSNIENGNRRPSPQVAKKIAIVLDFEKSWYRLLEMAMLLENKSDE